MVAHEWLVRAFEGGRIFNGGLVVFDVEDAVFVGPEGAVLGIENFGRELQAELGLAAAEAHGVIALLGLGHALGEGAGMDQGRERGGVLRVLLEVHLLRVEQRTHVAEGQGFGIRARGIAGIPGNVCGLWLAGL